MWSVVGVAIGRSVVVTELESKRWASVIGCGHCVQLPINIVSEICLSQSIRRYVGVVN